MKTAVNVSQESDRRSPGPLRVILVPVLCFCLFATSAYGREDRVWTSKNGKFQKHATLIETTAEKVVLRLGDGNTIEVPIASLSAKDQKYIDALQTADSASETVDPIVGLRNEKLGAALEKRIAAIHAGQQTSGEVLRVIYFHGSDSEPQSNYEERLHRVMVDIQDFYHREMKKNGFRSTRKLPLEIVDGKLVVHVVAGKNVTSSYTHENGNEIRDECKLALRETVDFDSDYTLVFCGLVKKRGAKYTNNAPDYGLPTDHTRGCSFVPECDMLDPLFSKDTTRKISVIASGIEKTKTLARYNTQRMGAAAHELGHALNLTHNGQTKSDLSRKGDALMGYGNRTYRNRLWDRKSKGAFMTLASSTNLAAHPLFTGSDKDRWKVATCEFESVKYEFNKRNFEISGVVKSNPPPLAVIAIIDPADGSTVRDYDATSWVSGVAKDGSFHVTVKRHLPGIHELRLTVLLENGATIMPVSSQYEADRRGKPDLERLTSMQAIAPLERLLAHGNDDQAAAAAKRLLEKMSNKKDASELLVGQLEHIVALAEPDPAKPLSSIEGDTVFLSDVEWESAKIGYGKPTRDRFFVYPGKAAAHRAGVLFQVGGKFHPKGLYAHGNSSYVFNLDGQWNEFESVGGLQAGAVGRVRFRVKGDGRELYRSDEVAGSETGIVKVSVKGVKRLELIAESTNKAIGGSWTIWASPTLSR